MFKFCITSVCILFIRVHLKHDLYIKVYLDILIMKTTSIITIKIIVIMNTNYMLCFILYIQHKATSPIGPFKTKTISKSQYETTSSSISSQNHNLNHYRKHFCVKIKHNRIYITPYHISIIRVHRQYD